MITYKPQRLNREDNRTPVMYDREIDELAHAMLSDYMPELLREPGTLDAELFLEQYLEANIEFHDIFNKDPERPILAMTAFTKGAIKVFNREKERVTKKIVPARTVIIDNSVMEPGKEGLALFSALHEGGHLALHWNVFANDDDYEENRSLDAIICCRRDTIESYGKSNKERTAEDWREHQADYFAAAIAMPNVTFRPFVTNLLRENNVYKGFITLGRDADLDILAMDLLPEYISETFGVSKKAARIKLRKCQFVLNGNKKTYNGY